MNTTNPDDVRGALAELDITEQKIVSGMFTVMVQEPSRVREREWMGEKLAQMTLMAGTFDADDPSEGVAAVELYLKPRSEKLVRASFLLFHQVALDMQAQPDGFTFEDAIKAGISYFPDQS